MITAYINCPYHPHVTLHTDTACGSVPDDFSTARRVVQIDTGNLAREMRKFTEQAYRFDAHGDNCDMWLRIDLDTPQQKLGVVHVVQALLAAHYDILRDATITTHC